tara:strand:+ start:140 stop:523 length:384 start_codon:yes stop_codon:yes gene_type:complete
MKTFLKNLIIGTIIILAVCLFPLLKWGADYWFEFLSAFLISLINAIVGYFLAISSISKPNSEFYKRVYGGMLVRMIFVLGFTLYMITGNFVEMTPFFISLMVFYVIHQWTEISGWMNELPAKKVQTQ